MIRLLIPSAIFALAASADNGFERRGIIVGLILTAAMIVLGAANLKKQKEKQTAKPEVKFPEPIYKNKGYTYEPAQELYCKQFGKAPGELTKEDEDRIWEYSYDDFAYLLLWIIENGHYRLSDENDESWLDFVDEIKRGETPPTEYLIGSDGYFMEDEVAEEVRGFVWDYIKDAYFDEVERFARDELGSEVYGFPYRREDYDVFKPRIDAAYSEYMREHAEASDSEAPEE